ncbi:hypothetical protein BpJC4_30150 [Weizmannia acidilactici]|uniref:Uncharacterized protein n=1 Tax=Heyndrickxia coagulans TaxID=1398 RepID=A0A150KKJ6_HEYCO|nr:hypothetical protein B4099_1530 [Heyndrickxia coagulans]GER68544.1 hypothetical protein BpJC4_30150 [Weizmannia acidilactici]
MGKQGKLQQPCTNEMIRLARTISDLQGSNLDDALWQAMQMKRNYPFEKQMIYKGWAYANDFGKAGGIFSARPPV